VVELTGDDLKYFSEFEKVTQTMPVDYLATDSTLIFLVDMTRLGKSIGKKGANIKKLTILFRKRVVIVGNSNDPDIFLRSYFSNIPIDSVEVRDIMGERAMVMTIDENDRGIAIGKSGDRIKAAKVLLKRKFKATLHLKTRRSMI
jgi:NusA-like KH domain protein